MAVSVFLPALFFALFFAWPVFALVSKGFFTDEGFSLLAVFDVFSSKVIFKSLWNTLFMALLASIFSTVLGLPLAYVFYRLDFWGRKFWRTIVMVPFVLPTTVVGVAFRSLFAENGILGFLKLDGTVTAIIVAMVFFNICVVVRIVGVFWQGIDPRFSEVACLLGASKMRIFRTITFPALLPSIVSSFSVVFLFCATSFGVVLIMGGSLVSTIETQIYILTTQFLDLKTASVLSILQIVLVAIVLVFSDRINNRVSFKQKLYVSKKSKRNLSKPKNTDWLLIGFALFIVVGLIFTPIVSLILRSFRRNGEFTFSNYVDLFSNDSRLTGSISVFEAMKNSLLIALIAAFVSVLVGFMVAFVVSRRKVGKGVFVSNIRFVSIHKWDRIVARLKKFFDMLFVLPLGISAAIVGFGFLITVNILLYDTSVQWLLVPLAQATVAVPLVVKTILPIVKGIDIRQLEAAALLGANPMRRFLTVEWNYFLHAILGAFGLALAVSFGEFGATSFLFRPEGATLPVMIYSLIGKPSVVHQGMAAAGCVVLTLFASSVMFVGQRFSR